MGPSRFDHSSTYISSPRCEMCSSPSETSGTYARPSGSCGKRRSADSPYTSTRFKRASPPLRTILRIACCRGKCGNDVGFSCQAVMKEKSLVATAPTSIQLRQRDQDYIHRDWGVPDSWYSKDHPLSCILDCKGKCREFAGFSCRPRDIRKKKVSRETPNLYIW